NPDPQALNRSDIEVESTLKKYGNGDPITGLPTLAQKIDGKVLKKVCEWLEIPQSLKSAGGNNFNLRNDGVWYISPDPDKLPLRRCGPLEVLACTRDHSSEDWGRYVRWHDLDGHEHTRPVAMSLFAGDATAVWEILQHGGLDIASGRRARGLL